MKSKPGCTTAAAIGITIFCILLVLVPVLVFIWIPNLFESGSLFLSKEEKCEDYAFDMAKETLETNLAILKDKENPSQNDLENIDKYERTLKNNAVLREDNEYYYNKCLKK